MENPVDSLDTAAKWATIVASVATVFAAWHVRAARNQISIAGWTQAQKDFTDKTFSNGKTFLDLRTRVFKIQAPILDWGKIPKYALNKQEAHEVCRAMDVVGGLLAHDLFTFPMIRKAWGDPFCKAWIVLKPVVMEERKAVGNQYKWLGFEHIGEKSLEAFGWPKGWDMPTKDNLKRLEWELVFCGKKLKRIRRTRRSWWLRFREFFMQASWMPFCCLICAGRADRRPVRPG